MKNLKTAENQSWQIKRPWPSWCICAIYSYSLLHPWSGLNIYGIIKISVLTCSAFIVYTNISQPVFYLRSCSVYYCYIIYMYGSFHTFHVTNRRWFEEVLGSHCEWIWRALGMCLCMWHVTFLFRTMTHCAFKPLDIQVQGLILQSITKSTIELLDFELDQAESSMTTVEDSIKIGNHLCGWVWRYLEI